MQDRVGLADVREELVAQALALRRALDEAGDVDDLDDRGDHLLRRDACLDALQARVRHGHDADVGVDRAERVVRRLGLARGEGVEDRALAHVGQADDADGKRHGAMPSTKPCQAKRVRGLALIVLAACGDNQMVAQPDAPDAILDKLRALPGVTASPAPTVTPGVTYYVLHFTQPVDHADPAGPTFQQEVSLLHRDTAAPMVVETDGYWDYTLDSQVELTQMLTANQISIEHRFFSPSRPDPADWSKDTIDQMAGDEHAIVTALKTIYTGPHVATGTSKGGMTALYYRRFFPDDVVATVAYVAPGMSAVPDTRFDGFFDTVGPSDGVCRQAVRDTAARLLGHRNGIETRAQAQGDSYTRLPIGPAVESAIQGFEWTYWQYYGADECASLPAPGVDDDALFAYLSRISPVQAGNDANVAALDAWMFQAYTQLGYPDDPTPYLSLKYGPADYAGLFPIGTSPAFDGGAAMADIDTFVTTQGARLLFIYGQWDPWFAGAYQLGNATDSLVLVAPEGTHGSRIVDLAPADRDAAVAKLGAWTGVTPDVSAADAGRAATPQALRSWIVRDLARPATRVPFRASRLR